MDSVRRLLPATLPLLAVLVAGCGGSSSSGGASATSSPAPTAAPTTTTSKAPAASPKAGVQKVAIKDFDYTPRKLEVAKGTKVTWTNADDANHTVTFDAGTKESLGNQPKGKAVSFTFTKAGTFAYHCDYHPNMHGTVVVR